MQLPRQRIPRSQKNDEWVKDCLEALIHRSNFGHKGRSVLHDLYDAYIGTIHDADYNYVTNPYNNKSSRRRRFPARLRNYNIIKPVVDLLLGEKSKRPFNFQVIVRNADVKSRYEAQRQQQLREYLELRYVETLQQMGIVPEEAAQSGLADQLREQSMVSYKDARAIKGQEALDFLTQDLSLFDQYQQGFLDWLITGETYSYKGVSMNEVVREIVSPLDIDYDRSPEVDFVEDGDWVVRKKRMTVNSVIDSFYDQLTPEQIDQLERPIHDVGELFRYSLQNPSISIDRLNNDREVEVIHGCWKSIAKVGILSYFDEVGLPQEMVVDETYKIDKEAGEEIEWFWVNEVWEGYRIDGSIWLSMGPSKVQRNELNNLSSCKLPYNGRVYLNRHTKVDTPVSIVSAGLPYQTLYNIFHYRLELTIAKNKDKIALMEINAIPKRHGWDEEKFMYYADAMGYAYIDSTAVGKNQERVTFNQYSVLDMSLSQSIASYFRLLEAIKIEWEENIGVSRQRKGQNFASDKVGVNERAVFQNSVITEELFRMYDGFQEKEMLGLLDCSKIAWKEGKHAIYNTSDLAQAILEIEPGDYQESEFGLYVENSNKEEEKLTAFKSMAMTFAQNSSSPSTIAQILDAENFSKIKQLVKEVEAADEQLRQQQIQQGQAHEQQMQQNEMLAKQEEMAFEAEQNQLDRDNKIEVAQIQAGASLAAQEAARQPTAVDQQKLALKERELDDRKEMQQNQQAAKQSGGES